MNSNISKFKSIDVDNGVVHYKDPHTFNGQMSTRKEMIKAWNEECHLREAELEIYYNEIHDTRDGLVQTPYPFTGPAKSNKRHD